MHYDAHLKFPLKQPTPYQLNIVEMLTTLPLDKKVYPLLGITSILEAPSWPSLTITGSGSKFRKGTPFLRQREWHKMNYTFPNYPCSEWTL